MSVEITVNTKVWDNLKKSLTKASLEHINLGWLDGVAYGPENDNLPVATVAMWMEKGDPAHYPPRPYFRAGFLPRLNTPEYKAVFKSVIEGALSGKTSFTQAYQKLGPVLVRGLKKEIDDWSTPPNSPLTVERKGFNNPLIETGTMRDTVDFKIEKGSV